ncbi:MAG: hypothetical protein ACRETD_09645, partial [Steroidobacteraceae bacterium]
LPVSKNGLGIRLASQLAPSAYLASAMGTRQLQDAILFQCSAAADESVDRALTFWSTGPNLNAPPFSRKPEELGPPYCAARAQSPVRISE